MHEKIRNSLIINKIPSNANSKTINEKVDTLDKSARPYQLINDELIVYDSKGGSGAELNCEALDKKGDEITCRHLASYLATQSRRGIKDYHRLFGQIESLSNIPYLKQNKADLERIYNNSALCYVFSIDELGEALALICDNIKPGEETSVMLSTGNHIMCFTLLHKPIAASHHHYVIKFYDPNVTDKHKRIIASSLHAVKQLKLSHLLDPSDISFYCRTSSNVTLLSSKKRTGAPIEIVEIKDIKPCIYIAMLQGMPKLTYLIAREILNDEQLSNDEKLRFLQGEFSKLKIDQAPPLALGSPSKHYKCVYNFTQAIIQSDLPISFKLKLLLGVGSSDLTQYIPYSSFAILIGPTVALNYYMHIIGGIMSSSRVAATTPLPCMPATMQTKSNDDISDETIKLNML